MKRTWISGLLLAACGVVARAEMAHREPVADLVSARAPLVVRDHGVRHEAPALPWLGEATGIAAGATASAGLQEAAALTAANVTPVLGELAGVLPADCVVQAERKLSTGKNRITEAAPRFQRTMTGSLAADRHAPLLPPLVGPGRRLGDRW